MKGKNKQFMWVSLIVVAIVAISLVIFALSPNSGSGTTSSSTNSGESGSVVSSASGSGEIKEFNMIAKQFEFDPGVITVNEGDTVVLHIESVDVEHGIGLPQFGVSETLPVGENVTVQFVADKKGTYTFFCNVYCGSGHKGMTGTLIVN